MRQYLHKNGKIGKIFEVFGEIVKKSIDKSVYIL